MSLSPCPAEQLSALPALSIPYAKAGMCTTLRLWHTSCSGNLACRTKKSVDKYIRGVRRDVHEIDKIQKGKDHGSYSSSY
jgi:hypothetical protein